MKWALASSLLVANSQHASGAVVAPRRVKRQQRSEQTTDSDTTARKPRRAREKTFFQNQPPQQQQADSREQENPVGDADSRLLSSSSLKESVAALRRQVSAAERLRNKTATTTKAASSSSQLLGLQECDPKENHDPDVGILSSCGDEQICQVSELSGLGGFCRPTTASKVEDDVINNFASKNARKVAGDILRAAREGKENLKKALPASKNLSSLQKKSVAPPLQSKKRVNRRGEGTDIVFCDPDSGILADGGSCPDHDQVCLTDSTSPLGGVCKQAQPSSSKKRRLEEPGSALDFGFDPYACDYSQFDREVNSGTVMCDYGTLCYYGYYSGICASITLSETIVNGESVESTACYILVGYENFESFYEDHNYCITQQFEEQTCSIEVYDTECNACSLNDNDDDAYGSGCFDFDW